MGGRNTHHKTTSTISRGWYFTTKSGGVWVFPHSTRFSGKEYHRSSKAARGEDLQVEHPILCRYSSTVHFHPTLPGMLGSTLIRDEVVQMCEPREKRLLAPAWVVKPFHREQFPVNRVMRLIQERTRHGHLGVCE